MKHKLVQLLLTKQQSLQDIGSNRAAA